MKDLIIIGAGGLGRETIWMTERINAVSPEWNILGFIDDKPSYKGKIIDGYRVLGNLCRNKQLVLEEVKSLSFRVEC